MAQKMNYVLYIQKIKYILFMCYRFRSNSWQIVQHPWLMLALDFSREVN